jgi:hypothetical protein
MVSRAEILVPKKESQWWSYPPRGRWTIEATLALLLLILGFVAGAIWAATETEGQQPLRFVKDEQHFLARPCLPMPCDGAFVIDHDNDSQ